MARGQYVLVVHEGEEPYPTPENGKLRSYARTGAGTRFWSLFEFPKSSVARVAALLLKQRRRPRARSVRRFLLLREAEQIINDESMSSFLGLDTKESLNGAHDVGKGSPGAEPG